MRILMVCLGNICRSPLAEGVLSHHIKKNGLGWIVDSAGTSSWHIGDPPDPRSQQIALENGIDISAQKARQFSKDDFKNFDKILTMDSSNYQDVVDIAENDEEKAKVELLLNYAYPGKNLPVPDPYFDDSFQRAYDLIEKACKAFINNGKQN